MSDIITKVEQLRAAGFTPVAILMSHPFHHKICVSQPTPITTNKDGTASANILFAYVYHDLPIKIVLGHEDTYSIEVK